MTFHLMFVHDTLSSVWIAEWPPFVFSHCVFLYLVLRVGKGFDCSSFCSLLTCYTLEPP